MTPISRAIALVLPLAALACTATSTPRMRVARDLGCTAEQTTTERIGEYRWQVTGCGHTATYVCTYPVRDCWREGGIQPVSTSGTSGR
jgi:hypothetical protein